MTSPAIRRQTLSTLLQEPGWPVARSLSCPLNGTRRGGSPPLAGRSSLRVALTPCLIRALERANVALVYSE